MKNPQFKNNPVLLQEVEGCFKDAEGITGIETNTLTGSVVIRYETEVLPVKHMVEMLHECRFIDHSRAVSLDHQMKTTLNQAGKYMGKIGLSLFMDRTLSGTGLSFITALL
jgi:hypothetical protein